MNFPILSVITFTPILAGMLILLFPAQRKNEVRVTALAAATFAQSAFDRVNRWQPGTNPSNVIDNNVPNKEIGIKVVDAVLTSDVDIQELLKSDRMAPFDYGNISLDPLYAKMVAQGWVLKSIPAPSGDTFFVLSACQWTFFQQVKDDETKFNRQYYNSFCP